MTVVRGLREALVLIVIAVGLAALAAAIWLAAKGGDFTQRFGLLLMILGALLAVTGDLTLSRFGTMEARTIFGIPPEREDAGGGRVLTGVGIFLFVAAPLMAIGIWLAA
ncbi:hypothetical protein ABZ807_14915 [Micromonospora sp. NPDC047548]|uniref:hypothetical protein n=1 Tax=Micromonospora sp. NPDC047548 TaxID=3155624 RepID=UPI0033E83880